MTDTTRRDVILARVMDAMRAARIDGYSYNAGSIVADKIIEAMARAALRALAGDDNV